MCQYTFPLMLATLALAGCIPPSDPKPAETGTFVESMPLEAETAVDADGDGYAQGSTPGTDCNDTDPDIHPYAMEICDTLDQDCDGLTYGEEHCGACVEDGSYLYCHEGVTWWGAVDRCYALGARLVIIDNGEENDSVAETAERLGVSVPFWINATDFYAEDNPWTDDGEVTLPYTAALKEDDGFESKEDYAAMLRADGTWYWNDSADFRYFPFVCEL